MSTVPDAAPVAAPPPGAPDRAAAPYMNPYLGGIGLGLVLLAAYVLMGRGLGASGALTSLVAWAVSLVAPGHASANEFFGEYLQGGLGHPLKTWLVFEVLGVLAGGFISGALAHRLSRTVEKGPRISVAGRLGFAFAGAYALAGLMRRQWR